MKGKFRVEIPDKLLPICANEILKLNNQVYHLIVDDGDFVFVCGYKIPREFIKEIKQPMTFEDKVSEIVNRGRIRSSGSNMVFTYEEMKSMHEWTVENERLKHEPKQKLDDVLMEYENNEDRMFDPKTWFRLGWEACEKSRGYNEQD